MTKCETPAEFRIGGGLSHVRYGIRTCDGGIPLYFLKVLLK